MEIALILILLSATIVLFLPVYASTVFVILFTPTDAPTATPPAETVPTTSEMFVVFFASSVKF